MRAIFSLNLSSYEVNNVSLLCRLVSVDQVCCAKYHLLRISSVFVSIVLLSNLYIRLLVRTLLKFIHSALHRCIVFVIM